jgi:hypothetical protein
MQNQGGTAVRARFFMSSLYLSFTDIIYPHGVYVKERKMTGRRMPVSQNLQRDHEKKYRFLSM